jgi:flagellar hook-length control protein FliK
LSAAVPLPSPRAQQASGAQQADSSPFAAFLDDQQTAAAPATQVSAPATSTRDARTTMSGSATSNGANAASSGAAADAGAASNTGGGKSGTAAAVFHSNAAAAAKLSASLRGSRSTGEPATDASDSTTTQPDPATRKSADNAADTSSNTEPNPSADPSADQQIAVAGAANVLQVAANAGASLAATAGPGKDKDNDSTTDGPSAAPGGPQAQQAADQQQQPTPPSSANSSQPIAAAVTLNTPADTTATTVVQPNTIDSQSRARGKANLSVGGPTATAQTKQDGSDSKPAAATQDAASTQQSAPAGSGKQPAAPTSASGDAASAQTPAADSQQQAQTQTDNGIALTTPSTGGAPPSTGRPDAVAATALSGASSQSNAQTATGIGNANGVPNIGLVSTNTATAATGGAAAPAAASAGAVPVAGLAIAITSHAQAGSNRFDIRLDPPELGGINVRLDVDSSGQVTSHITVDRPDTLQLLQSQQPQIQHALQQAGLKTADNGLQFTLRDQSFAGQNGTGGNPGGQQSTAQLVVPDSELTPVDTAQIYTRWRLGNGLDIRV